MERRCTKYEFGQSIGEPVILTICGGWTLTLLRRDDLPFHSRAERLMKLQLVIVPVYLHGRPHVTPSERRLSFILSCLGQMNLRARTVQTRLSFISQFTREKLYELESPTPGTTDPISDFTEGNLHKHNDSEEREHSASRASSG